MFWYHIEYPLYNRPKIENILYSTVGWVLCGAMVLDPDVHIKDTVDDLQKLLWMQYMLCFCV